MATLEPLQPEELAYEDSTPTPAGWRRKLIPYVGQGLVPTRLDVIFVAPTGDELRSRAQLQRFLKKSQESPSLSEFIWSTDEGPRRSSRSATNGRKSPPRAVNKKKPAAKTLLEELKVRKRNRPGKEPPVLELLNEDNETSKKKVIKVNDSDAEEDMSNESFAVETNKNMDGSLSDLSPKNPHKKRRNTRTINNQAALKLGKKGCNMATDTHIEQNNDKQGENRKQEEIENDQMENQKDEASEQTNDNGQDEAIERTTVLPMGKDEQIQETQGNTQEAVEVSNLKDNMKENQNGIIINLLGSNLSVEVIVEKSDLVIEKELSVHEENVSNAADQGEHANIPEFS